MPVIDWPQLLSELASDDNEAAKRAGSALLAEGSGALPYLMKASNVSPVAAMRRLVFLLGEIGRKEVNQARVQTVLRKALNDEDWKVRRNAAIALGKLKRDDSSAMAVFERLGVEADARVRHSLLLAFGRIAGTETAKHFASLHVADEEQAISRKVQDTLRAQFEEVTEVSGGLVIGEKIPIELWCRHGVADIVAHEATQHGMHCVVLKPDRVSVKGPMVLDALFQIRTALFPVLVHIVKHRGESAREIGEEFASSVVAHFMAGSKGSGAPIYRATLTGGASAGLRREWIEQFAQASTGLVNAATGYEWELIIRRSGNQLLIGSRPSRRVDARFEYRRTDRPASVHPTLAAAAVRILPSSASDVVLDPFCGSGTLLAERSVLGPYAALLGWDLDPGAIRAAHINLAGMKNVTLSCQDMRSAKMISKVDCIVTNPPYGHRVLDRERSLELHRALDRLAERVLRPGGTLVAFRPPGFPSPKNLKVLETRRVDAGGMPVNLIYAIKTIAGGR
jgi:hypothetical protein